MTVHYMMMELLYVANNIFTHCSQNVLVVSQNSRTTHECITLPEKILFNICPALVLVCILKSLENVTKSSSSLLDVA